VCTCAAPTNVTLVGSNTDSISIKWDAATDNVGVVNYYIYDNEAFVGSTSETTFDISRAVM
jgi:hypothetical protein